MTKAEVAEVVKAALLVKQALKDGLIDSDEAILMLRDLGYEAVKP